MCEHAIRIAGEKSKSGTSAVVRSSHVGKYGRTQPTLGRGQISFGHVT